MLGLTQNRKANGKGKGMSMPDRIKMINLEGDVYDVEIRGVGKSLLEKFKDALGDAFQEQLEDGLYGEDVTDKDAQQEIDSRIKRIVENALPTADDLEKEIYGIALFVRNKNRDARKAEKLKELEELEAMD